MKVTDDPKSMRRILMLLDATIILHNMLIVFREEEKKEWIDEDDCSVHCDLLREPTDELNQAIHPSAEKDRRRTQLLMHFKEKFFPLVQNINTKHIGKQIALCRRRHRLLWQTASCS
mgnify:CR=1 FL=1